MPRAGDHAFFSGRFDREPGSLDWGPKERALREIQEKVGQRGWPTYSVDTGPGQDFGEATAEGLYRMFALVAIMFKDYGEDTGPFSTYAELKSAYTHGVPILAVQFEGRPQPQGPNNVRKRRSRAMLELAIPSCRVVIDARGICTEDIATRIADGLTSLQDAGEIKPSIPHAAPAPAPPVPQPPQDREDGAHGAQSRWGVSSVSGSASSLRSGSRSVSDAVQNMSEAATTATETICRATRGWRRDGFKLADAQPHGPGEVALQLQASDGRAHRVVLAWRANTWTLEGVGEPEGSGSGAVGATTEAAVAQPAAGAASGNDAVAPGEFEGLLDDLGGDLDGVRAVEVLVQELAAALECGAHAAASAFDFSSGGGV